MSNQGLEHEPSVATRAKVKALASFGHPAKGIAEYLDIGIDCLRKHYREELTQALADTTQWVVGKLHERINDGDTAAMRLFLMTRGGFKSADKIAEIEALDKIAQAQTLTDAQAKLNELTAEKEKTSEF